MTTCSVCGLALADPPRPEATSDEQREIQELRDDLANKQAQLAFLLRKLPALEPKVCRWTACAPHGPVT